MRISPRKEIGWGSPAPTATERVRKSARKPLLLPITLISSNQLTLNLSLLTSKRYYKLIENFANKGSSPNGGLKRNASDELVSPEKPVKKAAKTKAKESPAKAKDTPAKAKTPRGGKKAKKDVKEDDEDGTEGNGKKVESIQGGVGEDAADKKVVVEEGTFVPEEEAEKVSIKIEEM